MCGCVSDCNPPVPEERLQHEVSNSDWHEASSTYPDSSDVNSGETTTLVHEPFVEQNSTQINVTTQLGSDVYLHCRVNDLRQKMVSEVVEQNSRREVISKSENEKSS